MKAPIILFLVLSLVAVVLISAGCTTTTECTNVGQKRCSSDGKLVQTCSSIGGTGGTTSREWTTTQDCSVQGQVCDNGACVVPTPVTESSDLAGLYDTLTDSSVKDVNNNYVKCISETDNKFDPATQGTVNLIRDTPLSSGFQSNFIGPAGFSGIDTCEGMAGEVFAFQKLWELYCDSNNFAHVVEGFCLNGCQNGACLPGPVKESFENSLFSYNPVPNFNLEYIDGVMTVEPLCTETGDTGFDPMTKGSLTIPAGATPRRFSGSAPPAIASIGHPKYYIGQTVDEFCSVDPNLLNETYCDSNGFPHEVTMLCAYGCQNGACNPEPVRESTGKPKLYLAGADVAITKTPGCSYGGDTNYDPLVKGSIIIPKGLTFVSSFYEQEFATSGVGELTALEKCGANPIDIREYYCDSNGYAHHVYVKCENGCQNGACVGCAATNAPCCFDGDGGLDYSIKTTTVAYDAYGTNTFGEDVCWDSTILREFKCDGYVASRFTPYDCADEGKICQNGACVAAPVAPITPGVCGNGICEPATETWITSIGGTNYCLAQAPQICCQADCGVSFQ